MDLKRIEIQNFMGIGSGVVDFNRPSGITLIRGENNDSPTSVSNGAGKSSIFEAVYWALFAKTKRGLTGDAVINREAKKCCQCVLFFDDYQIVRARKPNALNLFQDDGSGKFATDLTKGTIKETQALIEDIIKISELTFSKIAYFGQEDVKAFASLSDAELKKVFEQALNLTFLSEDHEKAKAYLAKLKVDLESKSTMAGTLEMQIKEAGEKIAILQKAAKDLADRREAEKLRILADIGADQAEIESIKQKYIQTQAEVKAAKASIDQINKKLDELKGLKKQLIDKHSEEAKCATMDRTGAEHIKGQIVKLQEKVADAANAVGQACETCKRPYTEDDIENVINGLRERIKRDKEAYRIKSEQAKYYEARVKAFDAVLLKLEAAIDIEREQVSEKLPAANPKVLNTTLSDYERQVQVLIKRIEDNQRVLVKLEGEDATYTKDTNDQKSLQEDWQLDLGVYKKEVAKLQGEYEIAELLVEALSNAGMKSYIFDNVTPQLNKEINTFASILDDMEIEVSTVKRLKNGELREKFHINVDNKNGAGEFSGNSGGEKQKVNLAVALGFNKVFRSMTEGVVNAVFLDEPFESLDKGSSDAVIELCKEFGTIGNVFVITHQDAIKDLITDTITVNKNGKMAEIL
jgi:DNA repair exonuclease SbcCD ATPase subunit